MMIMRFSDDKLSTDQQSRFRSRKSRYSYFGLLKEASDLLKSLDIPYQRLILGL